MMSTLIPALPLWAISLFDRHRDRSHDASKTSRRVAGIMSARTVCTAFSERAPHVDHGYRTFPHPASEAQCSRQGNQAPAWHAAAARGFAQARLTPTGL